MENAPALEVNARQDHMVKKTKRELTWIGKENRPKLGPCVLIEDSEEPPAKPPRKFGKGKTIEATQFDMAVER